MEVAKKKEHINQFKYDIAYCQHYLAQQPPSEAPECAAFTLGEEQFQLHPPTMENPLPSAGESSLQEACDTTVGEDIEMQDTQPGTPHTRDPQGATGGAASPISHEDEALLNDSPTGVTTNMANLSVPSPNNITEFQSETQL